MRLGRPAMLAKRWKAPSKPTLAVLRELVYFTSALTVGTAAVLHLLDLSRRTEELYYRALRAQKVEGLKNSLREPRPDGLSHIDAFILERLKEQTWDYEYTDPRAPPPQPPRRKKAKRGEDQADGARLQSSTQFFASTSITAPSTHQKPTQTDLIDPSDQTEYELRTRQCQHQSNRILPQPLRFIHHYRHTQSLKPSLFLCPALGRPSILAKQSGRAFSTKGRFDTEANVAQVPGSDILLDHDLHLSVEGNVSPVPRGLDQLLLSPEQIEFLSSLRDGLASSDPCLAIHALEAHTKKFQQDDSDIWFRPTTLSYLYRLARVPKTENFSSVLSADTELNAPLLHMFFKSDPNKSFLIFEYLFISNKNLNMAIPTHLALRLLDSLLSFSSQGVPLPTSYLHTILTWLQHHDAMPLEYCRKVLQATILRSTSFNNAKAYYDEFISGFLPSMLPGERPFFASIFVTWALSQSFSDEAYAWLQTQDISLTDVSNVWAIGVASAISGLVAQEDYKRARIVFFKSKFLTRCAHISPDSISTLESFFLLCVHQTVDSDSVYSRVAFHTLVLLAGMDDSPKYLSPFFELLKSKGHESNVFRILSRLELPEDVPFGLTMFHYFYSLAESSNESRYFITTRLVQYAKRTGDSDTVIQMIDEINTPTTVSKDLLTEVMSALVNTPFSVLVLEKFMEVVVSWPFEPDTADMFTVYFCDMIHLTWKTTASVDLVDRIFQCARKFYRHTTVPSAIPNLLCRILLRSRQPERCFHLLEIEGIEIDAEAICLIAVAASHSKNWALYESVSKLHRDRISKTLKEDSFYGNSVLESYLNSFGLVRGIELVQSWVSTFDFTPTRRTVYSLTCQAFRESRFEVLPEIMQLAEKENGSNLMSLLPPMIAALTKQWFQLRSPSSQAMARIITGIHAIDPHFATFHLRELWGWAFTRFSSSARALLKMRKGKEPLVPKIAETESGLAEINMQLQPLFRQRMEGTHMSPNELDQIEVFRSDAVIKIFEAVRDHDYIRVTDVFCDSFDVGIHTSPQACRQLSIACHRLGWEGKQLFSRIISQLESRGITFPLGATEVLELQELKYPLEIENFVLNFYQAVLKPEKKGISLPRGVPDVIDSSFGLGTDDKLSRCGILPVTASCSLAVIGAQKLIQLKYPRVALRLLQQYHEIANPEKPDLKFLGTYIRASRLNGESEGVLWAIYEALQSDVQLDDQTFLQQVDLSVRTVYPNPVSTATASSSLSSITAPSTASSDDSGYTDDSCKSVDSDSAELQRQQQQQQQQDKQELINTVLHLSAQEQAGLSRSRLQERLHHLRDEVFEQAVIRKRAADNVGDHILAMMRLLRDHAATAAVGNKDI